MMRGPVARFGIILLLVVLISLLAGITVLNFAPGFESAPDAIWWAFLRLTDPGYLGDDQGLAKALVSTVITFFGYILFTGALIAILVQWLSETMERLELGLTPVDVEAHFVLLGWTSRTLTILNEIIVSQRRVQRFLRQRGARRLHVVLLAESSGTALMQQLRLALGEHWSARQIILRSGSPLREDGLQRVNFTHAGAIIIPAPDTTAGSPLHADARTVKTLMTLGAAMDREPPDEPPLVVVEIQDTLHMGKLRALYRGPIEIIAGDELINRLIVQNLRHPGLSHVFDEFLSDVSGNQIYVREEPLLTGLSIQQLSFAFTEGLLLGLVRPKGDGFQALLNPSNQLRLEEGDRIVVLAPRYQDAAPPDTIYEHVDLPERPTPDRDVLPQRRVLILGWNHRVPDLLDEFASYPGERFDIDIVSQVSTTSREKRIAAEGLAEERIRVRHLEFDYTVPAYLESVDPTGYQNVLLLASEQTKPGSESDARTILGYLLLRDLMTAGSRESPILVELTDPDNMSLFEGRQGETIVSPLIVSRMLARVALRRELRTVFDELFSSGGCEIYFRRIAEYESAGILSSKSRGDSTRADYTFADLQRAADAQREIAIGIRRAGRVHTANGGVELNPRHNEHLQLNDGDELIVLTT